MTTKTRKRAARKSEAACSASMWAVMKAYSWESLEVMGLSLRAPPQGPCKFIPLFETRAQAIAFDGGCEDHVREVQPNASLDRPAASTGTVEGVVGSLNQEDKQ